MDGVSLSWRLLPQALIERYGLQGRAISRGNGDPEYRFLYRDPLPVLPVWYGELRIVSWGWPAKRSSLPRCREIGHDALQEGQWRELEPEPVEIPASFIVDRGIWTRVAQGVQGVLVHDNDGTPVVYVVTREATHYYQVMTRNLREPILIGEII